MINLEQKFQSFKNFKNFWGELSAFQIEFPMQRQEVVTPREILESNLSEPKNGSLRYFMHI